MRSHYGEWVFGEVKDSEWSENHIAGRGITLDEVREAILQRPYWQQNGRSGSFLCYGTTQTGKHLLVVVVEDRPGVAFVVTAREMTGSEKKTFRRRAR